MSKIHFDITDLLDFSRYNTTLSGIQRVSLELLSLLVRKHGARHLDLIGFHPTAKRVVSFGSDFFEKPYTYDQVEFCKAFGVDQKYGSLDTYLSIKYPWRFRKRYHRARLLLTNTITRGATLNKRGIQECNADFQKPAIVADSFRITQGDLIFIPGAVWGYGYSSYMAFLAKARQTLGLKLVHFIHDLIPIMAPEHVGEEAPKEFHLWLSHIVRNADRFLVNSEATKNDLDAFMRHEGVSVESRVVKLAHEFCDQSRTRVGQGSDIAPNRQLTGRVLNIARLPYVLCVGTIESRKNVWTLVNVWKSIYDKLGARTPRLIFAGKPGVHSEDFDDFMRGTSGLYGFIRIVERPSDIELAHLYRHCLFSIYPSYKEGWGLPVGECMWFGRPVICSNVSSLPEVGGALADYVDPMSHDSIEAAVLKMITDKEYREQRAETIRCARLRTWADVADDLWREIMADFQPSSSFPPDAE